MKSFSFYKALTFILVSLTCYSFGQITDFSKNYQPAYSQGQVPSLLTEPIDTKINHEISSSIITNENDRTNYAGFAELFLEQMFDSGDILFGEAMSNYVSKVGNRLLEYTPEINQKLDFFVLKSDYTNALVMEPGVVFVTTGLLSQIENEAQLAFVLSHEIAHYLEKHIQQSFVNKNSDVTHSVSSYLDLSQLSKNHEIEADIRGVKIYHDAGYSKDEISKAFIMLMYSYLPFDEITLDSTFFGKGDIYVPNSYFPDLPNPIMAFSEYNDLLSTHPNIKTRTTEVTAQYDKHTNWKNEIHHFSPEEFENVRNIARFESVRISVLNGNYVNGLYEVYILEKAFPDNEYLAEAKAYMWYELNKMYMGGGKRSFLRNKGNEQGEISKLFHLMIELDKTEMNLLSTRIIEDIYSEFPQNDIISKIREQQIKSLALNKKVDIKTLEKISFNEALALNQVENAQNTEVIEDENQSKYDKITQIQIKNSSSQSIRPLTDENFIYFVLSDVVQNDEFMQKHEAYYKEALGVNNTNQSTNGKRSKKKKKKKRHLVLIYSTAHVHNGKELNFQESKRFESYFDMVADKKAKGSKIEDMRFHYFTPFTVEEYNKTHILKDYFFYKLRLNASNLEDFYFEEKDVAKYLNQFDDSRLLMFYGNFNKSSGSLNTSFLAYDTKEDNIRKFDTMPRVVRSISKGSATGVINRLFNLVK